MDQVPRVVVAVPMGVRTGGPEALHQLVHQANTLGVNAALWPIGRTRGNSPVAEYQRYGCPVISTRWLPRGSTIVLPEIYPRELAMLPHRDRYMWWLSVDNSPLPAAQVWSKLHRESWTDVGLPMPPSQSNRRRYRHVRRQVDVAVASRAVTPRVKHLCQSHYALDFCRDAFKSSPLLVTDYLRLTDPGLQTEQILRVAYNPAKAQSVVNLLRERLPRVNFLPLEGMSHSQVVNALAQSAIYFEGGHMPGCDRIPRESAMVGTPVIALKRGAANYPLDLPLPQEDLIPPSDEWLDVLTHRLTKVLEDPEEASLRQREFQLWVQTAPDRFRIQVEAWLEDISSAPG